MGRKVHPIGMRLGVNETWQGRWFAEGTQYREQLHQDLAVRSLLMGVASKGGAAYLENVRKLRREMPEPVLKTARAFHALRLNVFQAKFVLPYTLLSQVSLLAAKVNL